MCVWLCVCVCGANWPCKTEAGLEFYRLLSGSQIPSSLRGAVGKLLNKHEVTEGNEFKLAKRRLAEFPNAPWKRKFVHEDGHEELVTHYRDPLVLMQHILRHPKCDPATDLVFGPEVETDGAACEPGRHQTKRRLQQCIKIKIYKKKSMVIFCILQSGCCMFQATLEAM